MLWDSSISSTEISRSVFAVLLGRLVDFFVGPECPARARFIVCLLGNRDGLRGVSDLHAQGTARRRDAEVLIAEATHQVKRLLCPLLLRQPQRIAFHLRLDRGAHVRRGAEESVRWRRASDALMRSLEVVVVDKQLDAPQAVREVGKHRLAQKFLPQRLPEALDLAEGLGMLRPTHAVLDPVPPQELLKLGLAAPRRVLPALVGQHLARFTVVGDSAL